MKMIPSRELAAAPGKVWKVLEEEGTVVITRDGKPQAILLPTSESTLVADVQDQVRSRARRAVTQIRLTASKRDKLPTTTEIDAEISAVRRERKG